MFGLFLCGRGDVWASNLIEFIGLVNFFVITVFVGKHRKAFSLELGLRQGQRQL
ncbi:MAG: hypothetical protein KA956_07185 [Pyrinomonadaceae bacterium]|nr:hypothetical protein [Acidobacteriota bacterium]MBK7933921.1 hypothetical protein [Acidobacteriota bacterium]MBP7376244.1 hypothetical protein [Pyrinomonadaceae bacterium]